MGIDFYMLNTLNEYNPKDKCVDMSEELQSFLYKNKEKFSDDINILLELDPYDDSVLNSDEIQKIYSLSESILKSNIINMYSDEQEAWLFFTQIKSMSQKALEKEQRIIAIGDQAKIQLQQRFQKKVEKLKILSTSDLIQKCFFLKSVIMFK